MRNWLNLNGIMRGIVVARYHAGNNIMQKKPNILSQVICPECEAVIITPVPEALIWERCPSCKQHIWDANDVLMAEAVRPKKTTVENASAITKQGGFH
jgi:hypothetical protein